MEGLVRRVCPLSWEEIEVSVRRVLGQAKNGSAPGPDGIGYRLIKAVQNTHLGCEPVEEVVDNLARGVILPAWREMRVVFIPKRVRDLTLAKNWPPLNLINCREKFGEKVVADRIQDFSGDLFHHLQFGSVSGRSAVVMLYLSVVRVRRCIEQEGIVGWGFWNMKGGFQNVVWLKVLDYLVRVEVTRGLCGWVGEFVAGRTFEMSWDGKVRGVGTSSKGVPQGFPLSHVLLLVWMVPILRGMERPIVEEVQGVGVEFPSYVDDLHCRLYVGRRGVGGLYVVG